MKEYYSFLDIALLCKISYIVNSSQKKEQVLNKILETLTNQEYKKENSISSSIDSTDQEYYISKCDTSNFPLNINERDDIEFLFEKLDNIIKFRENQETDAQVIFCSSLDRKTKFIIFPGSQSRKDWEENADFLQIDCAEPNPDCIKIHKGYWQQFTSLKNYIWEEIMEDKDFERIIISGHSLGHSLALLATFYIHYDNYIEEIKIDRGFAPDIKCIGLAGPKCGNNNFAKFMDNLHLNKKKMTEIYRIVNYRDLVPELPPKKFVIDYKHVNKVVLMYFKDNKVLNDIPNYSLWEFIKHLFGQHLSMKYHHIDEYIKKIQGQSLLCRYNL